MANVKEILQRTGNIFQIYQNEQSSEKQYTVAALKSSHCS